MTCYIDESGTDSDSPVAVVGGLVLSKRQFFWLDVAWRKCLNDHHIDWPLHMREFGPRGKYKNVRSAERRALFGDVAKVINENKIFSAVATLNGEQYRDAFSGISELSMYGACAANMMMMHDLIGEKGELQEPIAYMVDEGNAYKHQILEAHELLRKKYRNVGALAFDSDDNLASLQAADVISWSARRKQASELKSGFEPLAALFGDGTHIEVPYKREWMAEVVEHLRATQSPSREMMIS